MKILILGDSTSFSGGYKSDTYPVHLAQRPIWPLGSEITNPSIAGLTTGDAASYFEQFIHKHSLPDVIIVYLGNCDACATLYPKGRASFWGRLQANHRRRSKKNLGRNVMRPFAFDPDFNPALEQPEKLSDFEFNIAKIISSAQKSKIIIVSPIGNPNFIAGSGKGNFLFYRIFGIKPELYPNLTNIPTELNGPLKTEYSSNTKAAMEEYTSIIESTSSNYLNTEIQLIAQNNLAVLKAESGNLKDALAILEATRTKPNAREEIILYNIFRIKKYMDSGTEANQYQKLAYEADRSNYRIREPYRAILKKFQRVNSNVSYIDLDSPEFTDNFIDHCHLTSTGNFKLANLIIKNLDFATNDTSPATLNTCPVTPEYTFNKNRLLSDLAFGGHNLSSKAFNLRLTKIIESAKEHPLFSDGRDISRTPPNLKGEIGRYADAYITRLLAPYLSYAERHDIFSLFTKRTTPAKLSARLNILCVDSIEAIKETEKQIPFTADNTQINHIKEQILKHLIELIDSSHSFDFRYRTMMYWYFRESLRLGSQSRLSMLYDHVSIEIALESILGLAALGHISKIDLTYWCSTIIEIIEGLIIELETKANIWLKNFNNAIPTKKNLQPETAVFKTKLINLLESH